MQVESHLQTTPPQIIEFDCYREFLDRYYQYKKAQRSGFSYRRFSELCGIKSPNYLQLLIQGKRNLSEELSYSVCEALKLSKYESEYFVSLVRQENAKTDAELRNAYKEGLRAVRKIKTRHIPSQYSEVIKNWQPLLVRELVFLKDFRDDPEFVVSKLNGILTVGEATTCLELLKKLGFIIFDGTRWVAQDPVIDASDAQFKYDECLHFHSSLLKMWSKNLDSFPREQVEFGALNIPIASKNVTELKKRILAFQDEIIGWLESEKDPDQIVQLGTYLIPVSLRDELDLSARN